MNCNLNIYIRSANKDDFHQIVDIWKKSAKYTYENFFDKHILQLWLKGDEIEKYIRRMISKMHVAVFENKVVGVIAIEMNEIDLIWVDINYRRK